MDNEPTPDNEKAVEQAPQKAPAVPVPSFLVIAPVVLLVLMALVICQAMCEGLGSGIPAVVLTVLFLAAVVVLVVTTGNLLVRVFSSVQLAVVLLLFFALACIESTFVLQQPGDFPGDEPHQNARYNRYLSAQAPFVYRLTHPFRRYDVSLQPLHDKYAALIKSKFGQEYADEKRKELVRMIEKRAENDAIAKFINKHPSLFRALYGVIVFTRLDRAYSAWWFRSLSALLLLNTLCCVARRYRFRFVQTGFLLTHMGLIVTLVGAAIGSAYEQKGMMQFLAGTPGHDRLTSFLNVHTSDTVDLGFAVRAKHFKTEYRNQLEITYDVGMGGSAHPLAISRSFARLRKGRRIELEDGKLAVTVEDIIPHAVFKDNLVSRSDQPKDPAIELLIKSKDDSDSIRLYAKNPAQDRYFDIKHKTQVKFCWFDRPSALQPGIAAYAAESPALLMVLTQDAQATIRPIRKGDAFQHSRYAMKILDCRGDQDAPSDKPLRKQEPRNAAAHVEITGADGKSEQRWIQAKAPYHDKDKGILVALAWEPADFTRYLVYGIGSGSPNVLRIAGGKAHGPTALKKGQAIDTTGPGRDIFLTGFALDATFPGIVPVTPPADATLVERTFKDPSKEAIRLKIEAGDEEDVCTLLADEGSASVYSLPGYLSITFGHGSVKDYKAYLVVEDTNDPSIVKKEQIVEVNQPLSYGGYTFYQEKMDQKVPNYTGIKVKRDPGSLAARTGLVIMLLGILFVFYVKPAHKGRG